MYIENANLRILVNKHGGSMMSIFDKKRSRELLYQPQKDSWSGQDIFIFPAINKFLGEEYTYKGKTYAMESHGLLRYMDAEEIKDGDDLIESFHSNEDTLKKYPFPFEAKLRYHLEQNKLTLSYEIKNIGDELMYFALGAHPAFRLPGRKGSTEFHISENSIVFPHEVELTQVLLNPEGFVIGEQKMKPMSSFVLHKQMFREVETLMIRTDGFDWIKIEKKGEHSVTEYFHNAPYLAIWTDPHFGDFVCIEPWLCPKDRFDASKDITKKDLMTLKPGEVYHYSYDLVFD